MARTKASVRAQKTIRRVEFGINEFLAMKRQEFLQQYIENRKIQNLCGMRNKGHGFGKRLCGKRKEPEPYSSYGVWTN